MQHTSPFHIRIAKNEADSVSASRIYALSWKKAYRGIYSDTLLNEIDLTDWVETFNSNYVTGRFQIAILTLNGEDVAACGFGPSRNYDDPAFGEVTSFYALPEIWGSGYNAYLMQFALTALAKAGHTHAHIWVLKNNPRAKRFYEKCGFKPNGKELSFLHKGEHAVEIELVMSLTQ